MAFNVLERYGPVSSGWVGGQMPLGAAGYRQTAPDAGLGW